MKPFVLEIPMLCIPLGTPGTSSFPQLNQWGIYRKYELHRNSLYVYQYIAKTTLATKLKRKDRCKNRRV